MCIAGTTCVDSVVVQDGSCDCKRMSSHTILEFCKQLSDMSDVAAGDPRRGGGGGGGSRKIGEMSFPNMQEKGESILRGDESGRL